MIQHIGNLSLEAKNDGKGNAQLEQDQRTNLLANDDEF